MTISREVEEKLLCSILRHMYHSGALGFILTNKLQRVGKRRPFAEALCVIKKTALEWLLTIKGCGKKVSFGLTTRTNMYRHTRKLCEAREFGYVRRRVVARCDNNIVKRLGWQDNVIFQLLHLHGKVIRRRAVMNVADNRQEANVTSEIILVPTT